MRGPVKDTWPRNVPFLLFHTICIKLCLFIEVSLVSCLGHHSSNVVECFDYLTALLILHETIVNCISLFNHVCVNFLHFRSKLSILFKVGAVDFWFPVRIIILGCWIQQISSYTVSSVWKLSKTKFSLLTRTLDSHPFFHTILLQWNNLDYFVQTAQVVEASYQMRTRAYNIFELLVYDNKSYSRLKLF